MRIAFARMARSRAVLYWPGSNRPCALTKCVPVMPRRAASAFIRATKSFSVPPTFSATAVAMSLADFTTSIFNALSRVTTWSRL